MGTPVREGAVNPRIRVSRSIPLQQWQAADATLPSSFPEGWYFVANRQAVLKSKLIQKTWMGTNIVVWCDEEGHICVAESVCPHLGSDLGPATGGRVRDGRILCPFHGFEYDATGQCVATPFAAPPRNARLRVFQTQDPASHQRYYRGWPHAAMGRSDEAQPWYAVCDEATTPGRRREEGDHTHVTWQDLEELRDVGFSDENILEIIASVAFRNFSNRLNVALGLDDPDNLPELDPDLNEMLGAREASHVNI